MRGMIGQPRELVGNARAPVLYHGRPAGQPLLRVSLAGGSTQSSRHRIDGILPRTSSVAAAPTRALVVRRLIPKRALGALHGRYTLRTVVANQAGAERPTTS